MNILLRKLSPCRRQQGLQSFAKTVEYGCIGCRICAKTFDCNPLQFRDLSEISRVEEGGGGETGGGSQLFEAPEKGGVMQNGPLKGEGSYKYLSVIM